MKHENGFNVVWRQVKLCTTRITTVSLPFNTWKPRVENEQDAYILYCAYIQDVKNEYLG